jgi:hypothetical protein
MRSLSTVEAFITGARTGRVRADTLYERARVLFVGLSVFGLMAVCSVQSAAAATLPTPRLVLHSVMIPSVFSAGDNALRCQTAAATCDGFEVTAANGGARAAEGPVVLTLEVPSGLAVQSVELNLLGPTAPTEERVGSCEPAARPVRCEYPGELPPDYRLQMAVFVKVEPGAVSGETASATVSAHYENTLGEVVPVSAAADDSDVLGGAVGFGAETFSALMADEEGTTDALAGSHPYEFSNRIDLNTVTRVGAEQGLGPQSVEDVRDVVTDLPVGFLGSAVAAPKCTFAQLAGVGGCPANTIVGQIQTQPEYSALHVHGYVFNMVPEHGTSAEFAFNDAIHNAHVIKATVVPTSSGYVLRALATEVSQFALTSITTVFYGDPAAKDVGGGVPVANFTTPSDCDGQPLITTLYIDSWQHPGELNPDGSPDVEAPESGWTKATSSSPPVTGCDALKFNAKSFTSRVDTGGTDQATGLSVDLQLPQNEAPTAPATPPLKAATVTLPAGVVLNPAAATGLESCSSAQIGWTGNGGPSGHMPLFTAAQPACPDASKVGSVSITSPLLENALPGSVYLAQQDENPFGSLLAAYIVVDDPVTGTLIKIAGKLVTDPSTGRITGTFDENPQFPFSDLKLRFFGGVRGELATPEGCGTFTTNSELEPWSAPESGPNALISDSFQISEGCSPGFAPAFSAGTSNPQGGGYAPFVLSFSRQDSEQGLSGLMVTLPPGLVGKLAGISQCSDAQLAAAASNPSGASEQASPACPANSRIGSVQSTAGVGSEPFSLGGTAYLTGPYKGAPYGIAVVVPAVTGPFDLGNVVVRSKLEIDPNDAHVTVTSDPFPTIIDAKGSDGETDGFPIRLRSISVKMDRPGFTLNPTRCEPAAISATLTSTAGTPSPVSSHFEAANCASLRFAPKFSASTQAKASKANGTSLDVKVGYPTGPLGTYANIRSVKVDLPKQLPSRLTTLQRACVAKVFEANPADCPPESDVGMATAGTPLLSSPLTGPAYIVSHGGEAFPDLEIVLQGEGVELILDGNTLIKKGITSSTFKTIPDAPVSSFDLRLPTGKFSILTTNLPASAHYDLCGQTLNMPTVITAQNGAVIKQTTKIGITGCGKTKALTRPQKLAAALKACHKKKKGSNKRSACEKTARKRYGPIKTKKK